ncbi:MAG: hypothetical protein LC778_17045 [Acidobacteria bacterium]|nr:hypothetical protein [Acidobacteriota bacterium]
MRVYKKQIIIFINYYENFVIATRAQRQFFIDISKEFPTYSANICDLTASDSQKDYVAWSAPRPANLDGTVVPCAASLQEMKDKFDEKIIKNYRFADAFNTRTGRTDTDVIGIDLGITLLSAENLRSGKVWFWFMQNPEIAHSLRRADLR